MCGPDQLEDPSPALMACALCVGRASPVKLSTLEDNIDGKERDGPGIPIMSDFGSTCPTSLDN